MEELPFFVDQCAEGLRVGDTEDLEDLIYWEGLKLKVKSFIEGQRMIDAIARDHLWDINYEIANAYLADEAMRSDNDRFEVAKRRVVRLYGWVGGCKYVSPEVRSSLQYIAKLVEKF